jgi:hypothetical protein
MPDQKVIILAYTLCISQSRMVYSSLSTHLLVFWFCNYRIASISGIRFTTPNYDYVMGF